jgi:alpha-tubulin suppressor-like RCC1 family protein
VTIRFWQVLALFALVGVTACDNTPAPVVNAVSLTVAGGTKALSGSSVFLAAEVSGSGAFSRELTWTNTAGTLSSVTGSFVTLTVPSVTEPTSVTVTAISAVDSTRRATLTLTVNPPLVGSSVTGVEVSPAASTLTSGSSLSLTAHVTGTNNPAQGVLWSIVSGGGTLSAATGSPILYTAPTVSSASTVLVRASSAQDLGHFRDVEISLDPAPTPAGITSVNVSASRVALRENASTRLEASVVGVGGFADGVTWELEPSGFGTLENVTDHSVTYTAPTANFGRVVRVTARSVQDGTRFKTTFLSVNPARAAIATGLTHSLAVTSTGEVLSWGTGIRGELGQGSTTQTDRPSLVPRVENVVAVAAGQNHSLALRADGSVLVWGSNELGQLGQLGLASTPVPSSLAFNTNEPIIAIAAGGFHSLALTSSGALLSWGFDGTRFLEPTLVATNIVAMTTGGGDDDFSLSGCRPSIFRRTQHSLALHTDGTLLSWGSDAFGQLGNGGANTDEPAPRPVPDVRDLVAIAASATHSLVLKSDGTVLSWGANTFGQLGDGTQRLRTAPVSSLEAHDVVNIAAGVTHSLALRSDGRVLVTGADTFEGFSARFEIVPETRDITAMSAGDTVSLLLEADGTLKTWGSNGCVQLGNGAETDQTIPVAVLLDAAIRVRVP